MKTIAAVIVTIIASAGAMSVAEQRQMMIGVAQDCKASVGASDNDLSFLILKKPMVTKEGKCLLFCIMEGMGIVNGVTRKLNMDEFVEYIKVPAKGDANIITKLTKIVEDCSTITDPDNCEMAAMAVACLKKGMAAQKIKTDIGV